MKQHFVLFIIFFLLLLLFSGADEVKFKDTDGHDYVVDLRKMKEYMIENGQRKSSIGILKKDLTSGIPYLYCLKIDIFVIAL